MAVFIQKGDKFMTYRQATKRGRRLLDAERQQYEREQGLVTGSQDYHDWANQWILDNQTNAENNMFNLALMRYRRALKRLDQYRLADGRPAITEEHEQTDENGNVVYDDTTGEPLMETVMVSQVIEPLEAYVEQPAYNEEGERTGTETVPNPLIVQDDAERAEAQATIAVTPADVVQFAQDGA